MNSSSSSASSESSKVLSLRVSQSAYGTTIPRVWGTARVSSNLLWYGDFQSHEHRTKVGKGGGSDSGMVSYTYSASFAQALCCGPIAKVSKVWINDTQYAPSSLGFSLQNGALGQKPWSYLSANYPDKAVSYSGIAYAACANYDLGDNYSSPQWTFEVVGERATAVGGDAEPADVILDIWTDTVEGLGLPADSLANLADYRAWCTANDLTISLVADTQQEARQYIQQVLDATLAVAVPSQGSVKIVPIGDEAVGSWQPNASPVYDLTEDDLLDAPVITRAQPSDANNKVTVEYYDRSKDYATVPVTAADLTHVNQYGAKTNSLTLHCITRDSVAATVAASTLNRDLYVRSTVEMHVDQRFCLLEPMDLVTLTFGPQNLDKYVLRVTSVEEADDGELAIMAEEWPFGVATGTKITTQPTSGHTSNFNVAPGNANTPVIFEPPVSLAGDSEVWLLTSGGGNWGGAQVWVSLDDATYSLAGTIRSSARHGVLSQDYPYATDPDNANLLAIDISASGGQIVPVTQSVRDLYQSLCFVGNAAGGELIAYMGADLTGVGRYTLSNIRRGCYGSKISAHTSGDAFARLDGSQFRYAYESGMIGKTLYIKLLSFNQYGAALQSLADVSPVAYAVKGAPLGSVAGLVLESPFTGTTFAAKWNAYQGAQYYNLELWANNTLKKSLSTKDTRFSATISDLVGWGVGRTVELRVYAVAVNGQSTDASVLIASKPQITAPTVSVQDTVASMIVSLPASTDMAYKASRICISQTKGIDPATLTPIYDGPQTAAPAANLAAGTWYVRATQYDQFGPDALNWSSEVAVAVSAKADGVQQVADVTVITASAGANPPGGSAYWAVYDQKTGKMATWDSTTGKYTFAVSASDIAGKIANAQINQPLLDQIALISAPASSSGSVAAQVAAEAQARTTAIAQEAQARQDSVAAEAALRATAISTEATLRQTATTGLAQQISTLTAGVAGGFDPGAAWYFDNDVEGWTGPKLTASGGWIQASTSGTADGTYIDRGGISVAGSQYSVVRARVQRVTGSGAATFTLYYSTTSHGLTPLDRDSTVVNAESGDVSVIEWDTSVLDAGGNDWLNSTITGLRIQDYSGSTWRFDWIAIGRKAPGASMAGLQAETLARISADQAEATARTALTARVGTVESGLSTEQTTRANADSALSSSITALTSRMSSAESAITTEQSTRSSADSALSISVTALQAKVSVRPNLLKNGGFENGLTGIWGSVSGWNVWDNGWGRCAYNYSASGTAPINWPAINVFGGAWYVITGDSVYMPGSGGGGTVYFDLVFFDASGNIILDGPQNPLPSTHDFSATDSNRAATAVQVQAPTNAVKAVARFVFENVPAGSTVGCRQVKVEQGQLPATMYTAEGSLVDTNAQIASEAAARASADSALSSSVTALTSRMGSAESAITTEQTTRANADSALSSSINSVQASLTGAGNLLANSGFEVDLSGWGFGWKQTASDADATIARDLAAPSWVPVGMHSLGITRTGTPTGIQDANSATFSIEAGARYCLSGWIASQRSTCDLFIQWVDASGNYITEQHTQDNGGASGGTALSGWLRVYSFFTAPSNASFAIVSLRQYPNGGGNPYSWVVRPMLERATSAQTAPSPWVPSASGMLSAISQVSQTATATAGKIASSYGVTLSSNGYVSGLKSYNDGSTSSFRVTADQVFIGPSNLIQDDGFYSPLWWFNGTATAWPTGCVPMDGGSDGAPAHYLKVSAGASFNTLSKLIGAESGANYRARLRIYRSSDFVGKIFCGALFTASAWAQPGPTHTDSSFNYYNTNIAYLSNTEGLGAWQTYTGQWAASTTYPTLQGGLMAQVTAGYACVYLEVTKAIGTDMVVDGTITATKLASASVTTDKLQAGAVSADKISVSSLSAISAALGAITSATIELVSSAWSYMRTYSKWFADGVDGFISAARHDTGDYFQEFRATSGNALILEQKSNGPNIGWKYYTQVRDSSGVDRLVIDPAEGTFKFKGTIEATTFTAKSATSGMRVEMSETGILVYDANNVLRVRLGVW